MRIKYKKVKRSELKKIVEIYYVMAHSLQDVNVVIAQYNSLSVEQRRKVKQEYAKKDKVLTRLSNASDERTFFNCILVNLHYVASLYDIDPVTVLLCFNPVGKLEESILISP